MKTPVDEMSKQTKQYKGDARLNCRAQFYQRNCITTSGELCY